MSQHDYNVANGDGASIRTDVNLALAAIKSNNSDPSAAPSGPVQAMSYEKLLSATCQENWVYDGASWVLRSIVDPTAHKFYPANDRAIRGLTLSNNVSDATNDVDIAAGWTAADSDGCPLILTAALTKRLDASWAVGNNQGGLDTGSIANDVYHVWLIRRPDTGVVDVLLSASATSPTMPADYTQKRRIGAVIRSAGALLAFAQDGDLFQLKTPVTDVNTASPGTSSVLATLTVPDGVKVTAICRAFVFNAASTSLVFSAPDQTDIAPDGSTVFDLITSSNTELQTSEIRRLTDTSGRIRYRSSVGSITALQVRTLGWVDRRGQDAAA